MSGIISSFLMWNGKIIYFIYMVYILKEWKNKGDKDILKFFIVKLFFSLMIVILLIIKKRCFNKFYVLLGELIIFNFRILYIDK